MKAWAIEKLIDYEMTFYPKARPAAHYGPKGRQRLAASYMDIFKDVDDDQAILNAYMRMVRGKQPMPTVAKLLELAGWSKRVETEEEKIISGADIDNMASASRVPVWRAMKQADKQDGRLVHDDEWYQQKYGY